jgi:molybdopterin/thiamine biosynthesis adenylyltransferase
MSAVSERHARQLLLPGWDQQRLRAACVVVIGVGALGNAVSQALALAGVGRLILCDMDRIEPSNLSRAPLFLPADLGRAKVDAARDGLARIAPDVQVQTRRGRHEQAVGLAELRDADLVLGCLDSAAARLELAGRRGLVGAPWIDAATGPWTGEVRPYLEPDGPCYGCAVDVATRARDPEAASRRTSCAIHAREAAEAPAAATAPLSAMVGDLMALLAVRWLMGLPVPPEIIEFDGASGLTQAIRQRRGPDCPYHRRLPPAQPLPVTADCSVAELMAALAAASMPADAQPLAWRPFAIGARCRRCGPVSLPPDQAAPGACPSCGAPLHARMALELKRAGDGATLHSLGVPEREILPVRVGAQLRYVELAGAAAPDGAAAHSNRARRR